MPSTNNLILIKPEGGKYVSAYGVCSGCAGEWYRTGSAIVAKKSFGQIIAYRCKGLSELKMINGYGHCHRIR